MVDLDTSAETATMAISDALHRLIRSVHRRKAQLATEGQEQEWAAHALLEQIAASGPLRAAYLAECTATDPSTVSRHVASLVKSGLIERRADPVDGRASLLVSTMGGDMIVARQREQRRVWLHEMLESWPDQDLTQFGALLQDFVEHLEAGNLESRSSAPTSLEPDSISSTVGSSTLPQTPADSLEIAHHSPALQPASEGNR